MYCRKCHYDLRDLPTMRCPECGKRFHPQDPDSVLMELPKPLTAGQWASRLIAWGIIATIAGGVAYVIIQFQNMPPSGH